MGVEACNCSRTGTARRRADSASPASARDGGRPGAQRVSDPGRYGQGLVAARERVTGRRRRDRGGFVALALALYAACGDLGHVARRTPGRRPLPRTPGARLRRGGGRRPPAARVGLLAARGPARAWRRAVGRPVLVPARGESVAEPPGVAPRDPVLAAPPPPRQHLGLQPDRSALRRRGGRSGLLVAARARARPRRGARRRARVRPRAVPGRAIHRPPTRVDRVPASRGAARARAASVRVGRARARRDSSLRADPPRDGRRRARAGYGWARVPRHDWWKAGAGAVPRGRGRRSAAGRRRRLDRGRRALVRAGPALLCRALRPGHTWRRSRDRGVRLSRLAHSRSRPRRPLGGAAPSGAWPSSSRSPPSFPCCSPSARTCRSTIHSGRRSLRSASHASRSACCRSPAWPWPPRRVCRRPCVESTQGIAGRVGDGAAAGSCSCCSLSMSMWRYSARSRPIGTTPPMRRSAGTAGCSSCRCSVPTSISAPSTSHTPGSPHASGRRATRRRRHRRRAARAQPCARSPAGAGRCRPGSASAT